MTKPEENQRLRVYEYARSLNMSSKEIITILKRLDIPVNNHMSVIDPETVGKIEEFFHNIKTTAAAKRAASQEAQKEQGRSRQPAAARQTEQQAAESAQVSQQSQRASTPNRTTQARAERAVRSKSSSAPVSNEQRKSSQQAEPAKAKTAAAPSKPRERVVDNKPAASTVSETTEPTRSKTRKTKPNERRFDDHKQGGPKGGSQARSGRGRQQPRKQAVRKEKIDNTPRKMIVRGAMTVGDLAKALHKDAAEVIKKLMSLGVMAAINQEIDLDTVMLIADEYKVEVEVKIPVEEDNFEDIEEVDDEADLVERPPVVTIMGHVDHGKTTLLDAIRQTHVTAGEAGGITQHIGAYQIVSSDKKITFLDTPGHEAFTTMRARGAEVTDITILVVAADDGVMPQTVEAISHAKAADVPIIVAVNKIDKPEANPDKIKQSLTEYGLVPEEWGGDTIFVNVSAKNRTGLDDLVEMILLVAEVQELKANPDKRARGTIIEAELDKGRGPVVRVLIQHGTLKVGNAFIAGVCFGRVRAMVNDKGKKIKEAGPSTPVELTGLTEVPLAGDPFIVFEDERKAREIAARRAETLKQSELGVTTRVTLDDLYQHIQDGEIKELNIIIKADVQGSAEVLKSSLEKIEVEGVRIKVLHSGAGAITESDVILASASNATIIGFNVRPEVAAKQTAEQEKVDIRLHNVIYSAIEEVEAAMTGMLEPEFKEVVIGHAEIRNKFKINKNFIAGCMVTSGKITRTAKARLVRDGIVVYEGEIDTLRRFKDDVREVAQGYECGITLDKFSDISEGDIIEAYIIETVER